MKRLFAVVCVTLVVPLTILALASGGRAARAVKSATPPQLAEWLLPADAQPVKTPGAAPISPAAAAQPATGLAIAPPAAVVPNPPAVVPNPPALAPVLPTAPPATGQTVPAVPLREAVTSPPTTNYATAPPTIAQLAPGGTQPSTTGSPPSAGNVAADRLSAWGPPPAPRVDPRRFTEAHWQGLEVIPKTPTLAKALRLPANAAGVILDDATLPADLQGFQAGDLVMRVGGAETPDLMSFIRATDQVRDLRQAEVVVFRSGAYKSLVLTALLERLGTANGETPPMIQPGSAPPHRYEGPCLNCHRIGTSGQLAIDQGDVAFKTAPPIRAGSACPHRDRGTCSSCHQLLQ